MIGNKDSKHRPLSESIINRTCCDMIDVDTIEFGMCKADLRTNIRSMRFLSPSFTRLPRKTKKKVKSKFGQGVKSKKELDMMYFKYKVESIGWCYVDTHESSGEKIKQTHNWEIK